MHEQFPWLWESVCGQVPCPDWPEGLLTHNPDSQGKGTDEHFNLLSDFIFLNTVVNSTFAHTLIMFDTIFTIS